MNQNDPEFEKYRRERKRHFLEGSPRRDLGDQANVLRQLEDAENREARDQKLSREVHDFFADATRTAASIVNQVSESAERDHALQIAQEMSDFLNETLARAQQFVTMMQMQADSRIAHSDVQPNVQNLVGPALDQFRHEGTSSASDAHIGLDPFAVSPNLPFHGHDGDVEDPSIQSVVEPLPDLIVAEPDMSESFESEPVEESLTPSRPIDDHLVAAIEAGDDVEPAGDPEGAMMHWFHSLMDQPERIKDALRAMVRSGAMTREQARSIWLGLHSQR